MTSQSKGKRKAASVEDAIIIDSDTEDAPIAPPPKRRATEPSPSSATTSTTTPTTAAIAATSTTSLSGVTKADRAAMEAERLARQRQRESATASASTSAVGISATTAAVAAATSSWRQPPNAMAQPGGVEEYNSDTEDEDDGDAEPEVGIVPPPQSSPAMTDVRGSETAGSSRIAGSSAAKSQQRFWEAEIRPTYNEFYPDTPGALKAKDIVCMPEEIQLAFVSSYCYDTHWICSLFTPSTPLVIIRHHEDPGIFEPENSVISKMYYVHPRLKLTANGHSTKGTMHIKFWILLYPTFCRVAIVTANAVDYDYGSIENMIWVQDFPRKAASNTVLAAEQGPFIATLIKLLLTMGVLPRWANRLNAYDFTSAKARLVPSVAGVFKDELADEYGLFRLAKEIRELGLQSGEGTGRVVSLECQGSSTGSYKSDWIKDVHRACSGITPVSTQPGLFNARPTATARRSYIPQKRAAGAKPDKSGGDQNWPPLKILFPSWATVRGSLGGPEGGGTIFAWWKYWNDSTFPSHLFWDTQSKRTGVLQHTKMILGTFQKENGFEKEASTSGLTTLDTNAEAFLYLGSHNLTPAAWGRITGPAKTSALDISNWELGVLMPVAKGRSNSLVGWQRPVLPYGHDRLEPKRSNEPWMQFSWKAGRQT